uniref:Copia protein n=1 Tax=Tanacetum cinerariifolium TaxID=118510 RepID=A0A6L2LAC0_TANCI|nr:copia protein [Tanacetum cinerariifolium]
MSHFTMPRQEPIDEAVFMKVHICEESTFDNDARDQASKLETTVLVDGKKDDVKVVGVIDDQNSEELNVLEDTNEQIRVLPPKTAEEILARERERKARNTLLMAIPEEHLAKFYKITDTKEMWKAIKSRFGGNDESKKMQKYILKKQFEGFSVSNSEGLHKGYDRFQSILSQLEIHGAGVSTEDANQKFLRSLPSSWSQVSLIMRTKPGVDTLSFDDLYNSLRVFESDVKGSTASSSSTQNVAFVSSDSTNNTNEVSTAYGVSTSSGHNSQKEGSSSYTDELIRDGFEMAGGHDFHKIKEVLQKDREKAAILMPRNQLDSTRPKRRDAGNTRHKARDNGRRPAKHDEHKAMVTIDGEGVDWTGHAEDGTENYALMAFNSSNLGSNTEVTSCSKVCEESYAKLKKLYDEQREQLGVASIEIQAYTLALEKGLSKLLNSQTSVKDKYGLWYGTQIHEGVLSYENEVLESVFDSQSSDVEDSPINDRFVKVDSPINDRFVKVEGMHDVPPPMTGIYMPPKFEFRIDKSKFSVQTLEYVPKPVESKLKAVSEPKVWSDAPIIKEYESDTDDEYVFKASVEQEKPSYAFINTAKHVKTPRQTVKDQDICSQNPKVPKRDWTGLMSKRLDMGYGYTRKACFDNLHQTLKGKSIVESGCSRHMTRNKAYLVEYQDFNGGPVAFGGSKGQIIDTECLVLSPNFKLPDEHQVLLGVPKQNNMYSFNLENVVPSRDLACLIAKATVDESSKWNRRLGHPVTIENKVNITAGPKEANNSAGTKDNINAGNSDMEAEHVQEYFVLPLWSSYTLTVKSSEVKNGDEKLIGDTGSKTNEEPVDPKDQVFLEELERLKRQEKEADDAANTLRKTLAKSTEDLLLQAGAARASNTNCVNTASITVNTASTIVNTTSTPVNTASSLRNDIYEVPDDEIFTSASYDDEGAVADFTNLESNVNGHRQEEGIDYDEVSAPVAWIESIRIFLAFASYMGFIVYQMDVKSAFLYGKIDEEVYVSQPSGFIDPKFLKKVYKVAKALYGLYQAPRAWYATLSTFLVKSGYRRGLIDKNLFIKKDKKDIMLVQVYVDGIIFGSTKKSWCDEFEELMKSRFQMSSMGELTFFLGLQVKQKEDGIFISQDKYVAEILKKFDFISEKTSSTPIETKKPSVKDAKAANVDVRIYKSMIGSLMYLTASKPDIMRLISWQCKKQTIVATSTTKAEYVVAVSYRGQVLWIQLQMLDYGFNFINTKIYIDNESTTCIVKNLVFHSKTKHIEIRHHFIRDVYKKKLIQVLKILTDEGVNAAVETLSTTTITISTAEITFFLLGVKKMKEEQAATSKETSNPFMDDGLLKNVKDAKVSNEFKIIKEKIKEY